MESNKFYTHSVTYICQTDIKFHRNLINLSFCLKDFHFFRSAVTDLYFQCDLLVLAIRSVSGDLLTFSPKSHWGAYNTP